MKLAFAFSAVLLMVMVSSIEAGTQELPEFEVATVERGNRQRRLTCDLLSFETQWVTINHAACAAHCYAMLKGFKGGYCEKGVCICRR